jgi:hypothetical protein
MKVVKMCILTWQQHTEEEKKLFSIAIGPGGPWAAAGGQPDNILQAV